MSHRGLEIVTKNFKTLDIPGRAFSGALREEGAPRQSREPGEELKEGRGRFSSDGSLAGRFSCRPSYATDDPVKKWLDEMAGEGCPAGPWVFGVGNERASERTSDRPTERTYVRRR